MNLFVRVRKDVRLFVEDLKSGKSTPLLNVTSGYHYHTIRADNEEIMDIIIKTLEKNGRKWKLHIHRYSMHKNVDFC